ncbi:MAG TPA: glycosyltransferase, partial [Terriglobales bacterium]|nr:glycosyltransferase [Terriglobales bacterium]
ISMKIAILGTRGIPARYGGFETLAEQLANRLAERGHLVTVYCRRPFTRPDDVLPPGVKRVILPTISRKHLDTIYNSFLSVFHVGFSDAEVVLLCNVGNSPLAWIPRLFGKPTALHVDGLDRKRKKWKWFARQYLLLCEFLSAYTPTRLLTDAIAIRDYYLKRYGRESAMIAYGAEVPQLPQVPWQEHDFDVPQRRYILYVCRLEPENNPELVIRAAARLQTDWPLVVVGDNKYTPGYVDRLKSLAGSNVRFVGAVYGPRYWELQNNAGLFVSAFEVGGIHPSLVEAMAAGNTLLYLDTNENREAVGDCGVAFHPNVDELASAMQRLLDSPELREELARKALARAAQLYSWERIVDQYEQLFSELADIGPLPAKADLDLKVDSPGKSDVI